MAQVQGTCDPRFEQVRARLQQLIDSGEELGAAIAVNLDGENVVDLWGGYTDEEHTREWEKDTIVNVFSSTKNVLSLSVLLLVERGVLSLTDKVCKHWPEFAANGKQDIEIRHVLSHTSGVSGWDADGPLSFDDISDMDAANAKLAAQAPWWTPGSASGYHTWTFGHLLSEIVRRATGVTLRDFVMQEIVKPLGADFQFGVADGDLPRTTDVIPAALPSLGPGVGPQPGFIAFRTMNPMPLPTHYANTPSWRKGDIISASGFTNGRALARILSAVTLGGSRKDDAQLLSQETVDQIFQQQSSGVDVVIGAPLRFGCGYALTGEGDTVVADWLPNGRVCFWGGMGGSMVVMDLDKKLTIAYVMNKMSLAGVGNNAVKEYVRGIYTCI
ncbi:beta-lactamase [Colletotrichum plurivorum]|uniref:Beta-lactamase n=1 Tax=Colletotrichum plurivorum TaxID=2175906 RepID=A0A8H6NHJ2_9PEZI|nr:beta-lactamase [Colletotrichum plurivorum]